MTLSRLYVYRDKLVVPTVARLDSGLYVDTNPVEILPLPEHDALHSYVEEVLSRSNPEQPTPEETEEPGSVILEALGLKKWGTFEVEATLHFIQINGNVVNYYTTERGPDLMWRRVSPQQRTSTDGITPEFIEFVVNEIHNDYNKFVEQRKPATTGGLMLLPSPNPVPDSSNDE